VTDFEGVDFFRDDSLASPIRTPTSTRCVNAARSFESRITT